MTPDKPGYYWARWVSAAAGTHEGSELAKGLYWEIVEVWENFIGEPCEADACEKFGVSIHGVRETQWLDNFEWGDIVAPPRKFEDVPEADITIKKAADIAALEVVLQELLDAGGDCFNRMYDSESCGDTAAYEGWREKRNKAKALLGKST